MILHFDGAAGGTPAPEQKPDINSSYEAMAAWLKEKSFGREHFMMADPSWTPRERKAARLWVVAGVGDPPQLPSEIYRSVYLLGGCGCMATAVLTPITVEDPLVLQIGLARLIVKNNNDPILKKLIKKADSVTVSVVDATGRHCTYTFTRTPEYMEQDRLPPNVFNLADLLVP